MSVTLTLAASDGCCTLLRKVVSRSKAAKTDPLLAEQSFSLGRRFGPEVTALAWRMAQLMDETPLCGIPTDQVIQSKVYDVIP